jgi:hypothetical protein
MSINRRIFDIPFAIFEEKKFSCPRRDKEYPVMYVLRT